ncbi:MAG: AraC family transcriptional regulator [Clostridia bacterium]|nr:AraC family transcriptional regulator [Clostridia bacterium]
MYPEIPEVQKGKNYWYDEDCFKGGAFHYINTYLHKDYGFRMHSHQFYEMNIVTSGSGRHYIDENYVEAKPGDVFIIPPDTNHGYYAKDKIDIYHILIKSDFIQRYKADLSNIREFGILFEVEPTVRSASSKKYNLTLSYDELNNAKIQLSAIVTAEKEKNYIYQNALSLAFICGLCDVMRKKITGHNHHGAGFAQIVSITEYIKNNLDKELSLDDIAKASNFSKATLNRLFRAYLNLSPMKYVLDCRISAASSLIAEKKYTKSEISQMCGFYDLSHMNKYMKKRC